MEINNIDMAVLPKGKIVPEASIARKLLKDGYKIIDIKPKKSNHHESAFVFEVVPGLIEKVEEYTAERKSRFAKKED